MSMGSTAHASASLARRGRRAGGGAGRLWLASCVVFLVLGLWFTAWLVLLALMFSTTARASTVASGLKAASTAAPTLAEPVVNRPPYTRKPSSSSSSRRPRHPSTTSSKKRPDDERHRPPIYVAPGPSAPPPPAITQATALPRYVERVPEGRVPPERVARQILALIDESRPQSLAAELARAYRLELLSSRSIVLLNARATLFRVPAGRSETAALAALQGDPRVRSAQFNMLYLHSDDRRSAGGRASLQIPQYGPRAVRLPEAHRLASGRNVMIAVIDSAVDTAHPDFKGAEVRSFDVVGAKDAAPDFHGTAVAGIIGSHGVVEAVAPNAQIMSVRAFHTKRGGEPETTTERLLAAIDVAAVNGARVINMSFVGYRDGHLQELLQTVSAKGVILVAAAGNGGPKAAPAYPAAYPEVIAVTAVDEADRRYEHANRGRYIAIAAPGVDVLAPVDGGRHQLVSGTSYATAYISGIAALLLEREASMNTASVAQAIAAGADDLGPAGRDDDFGAGRVNALAALQRVQEVAAHR